MASLRRDTPAGRAALARRRQRAAAVVEHQSRFVNDEEGDEGENPNANVNAELNASAANTQQKQQHATASQQQQQTVEFQSPDTLLERSARVAQTAASVLASVRKNRPSNYASSSAEDPPASRPTATTMLEPEESSFYQMPTVSFQQQPSSDHHDDEEPYNNNNNTMTSLAGNDANNDASNRRQIEHARRLRQNRLDVTPKSKSSFGVNRMDVDEEDRFAPQEIDGEQQEMLQQQLGRYEENVTAEGLEPTMPQPVDNDENRYPGSLATGSVIVLRSVETCATVTATTNHNNNEGGAESSMAMVGAAGISATDEVFEILKFTTQENGMSTDPSSALRWGDTISIVAPNLVDPSNEKPKALGIRRPVRRPSRVPANAPVQYQIGCFRSVRGPSEMWTVLRGPDRSSHPVMVGMASLQNTKKMAEERVARGQVTMQVQSGDPLLLRNMETGGLLTVNPTNGSLELLMDAYDSRQGNTNMDSLEQLQRNYLYVPTDRETFVLLESSVPPCPRWILGGGTSSSCNSTYNPLGHRMYLHQTYTAEPGRDNMSRSLQAVLFGHQGPSKSGLEVNAESVKRMKLADQESLLLDEVIGACLGLEGNFIRTSLMREEEMPQVDGSGMEGPQYLEFNFAGETDLLFDSGLRNLARGLMPLATSYMHVSEFVASHLPGYEFGSVMQALCEALEAILKEYTDFVGMMEQQFRFPQPGDATLTLQRLYVQLMPSLDSMALLRRVTLTIRGQSGGALVNCLAIMKSESCEGDLVANKVLSFLLDRSSIPYMTMLTTWLQYGLLKDPYKEFMIEVQAGKNNGVKQTGESDVSDESYVLKEEHVLTELMASDVLLQKVAATGKYRRAVRLCQTVLRKAVARSEEDNDMAGTSSKLLLRYSLDFNSLSSFIQSMYEGASQALVSMLLKDFNLLDALRSMKQYFLLDHGDFLENFLNSAEDELVKDLGDISSGRIQHWLRMAVQLTEVDHPANSGSAQQSTNVPRLSPLALRCRFVPVSLIQHVDAFHLAGEDDNAKGNKNITRDESILGTPLRDAYGISNKGLTGVETFMLEYPSVPFPISLVLRESALASYQLLFRLLFFAKYAERRLLGIWQDHQAMKELSSVRGLFGPTFLLRQRMLHFAQNLIYYFVAEVIEPNWLEMEEAIGGPSTAQRRTVDDLVDIHSAFLRRTIEACLLTNKDLVRTVTKLMTTCLMFADQMKLFTEATRIYDESSHIAAERREAIQRSLNDRVSGGPKVADKKALREAIHSFKQDRQIRLKKQKRRVGRELASESYRRMVGRFEEVFSAYLSEFMTQLNGDVGASHYTHRTNLCSRLDYNGFMFSSLQKAEN